MKRWIAGAMLFVASVAQGQALSSAPPPAAIYIGSMGSWSPWASGSGMAALSTVPPAVGAYCSVSGNPLGPWTPCAPGSGGGTVTGFTSGALSPLFTTNVANPTTAPALTFSLTSAAANSYLGNSTGSAGAYSFLTFPSCSTSSSALNYTNGTGVGCNASINASTLLGATWSAPGAIGSGTPGTGAFSTVTVSGGAAKALQVTNTGTTNNAMTVTGVGGASSAGPAAMKISLTGGGGSAFYWGSETLCPACTAGDSVVAIFAGVAEATRNEGHHDFHYVGSGSTSNSLTGGFYGGNQVYGFQAGGIYGIGGNITDSVTMAGAALKYDGITTTISSPVAEVSWQATTIYSAAGTPLPTCNTGEKGAHAVVSDATTPTYLGIYASAGAVVAPVVCNGTNWVTY